MPVRRTYAKNRKGQVSSTYHGRKMGKVRYGKRRAQVRNKVSVPVGLGFPKRMVMTHKYCDLFNLTSSAGVINKFQFSCNGMFDPNITSTGHQPLYFDQMGALYNHYTVIGSRMKITCTPNAASATIAFVGAYLDDDTSTTNITGAADVSERTTGKIRQIPPNSNNSVIFYNKWSAKKTFGGSILGNDNLQGTTAANPTEQTYYTLFVQGGTASDFTIALQVEIQYIAVWEELKDVAAS